MLKSAVAAFGLASVALAGFAGLAQAQYGGRQCAMPIMKGGCPIWIPDPQPGLQLPKPPGK
jgi:hypothetical protein